MSRYANLIIEESFRNYINEHITHEKVKCHVSYDILKLIYDDLSQIGWKNIQKIDSSLKHVSLLFMDSSNYGHQLDVDLPDKYGTHCFLSIKAELPSIPDNWMLMNSLPQLYNLFVEYVCKLEYFWKQVDILSKNTWLLEPEVPKKTDTHFRIALKHYVSLVVDINPDSPHAIPNVNFVGPDDATSRLKDAWNSRMSTYWCVDNSIYDNLRAILDVEFPNKETNQLEDVCKVCSICLTANLENELPDIACECQQSFHQTCILEWFSSLRNVKISFGVYYGECPFCEKILSVKSSSEILPQIF